MKRFDRVLWILLVLLFQGCNSGESENTSDSNQNSNINLIQGSSSVLINGVPAARAEDPLKQSLAVFAKDCATSPNVKINGKAAVILSQSGVIDCEGAELETISANVKIGR